MCFPIPSESKTAIQVSILSYWGNNAYLFYLMNIGMTIFYNQFSAERMI